MAKTPAQALLDEVIQSALVPMLKAEGYRKAGHTFRLATPRCVLVVNVQASQWSSRDALNFTLNFGAFYPELNEVMQRGSWANPGASGPTEALCHIRARIGRLMPSQSDVWWELQAGSPPLAVATEVMEALRDFGLPWLHVMGDLEAARHHAEGSGRGFVAASLAILVGRRDEAKRVVVDILSREPDATGVRVWAKQVGLLE